MVTHLMPLSTQAPRCSEFARSIGALPVGTGLFLERVVLITVPLPWPKPALGHGLLKGPSASVTASEVPSRLFACAPFGSPIVAPKVEVFERDAESARRYRWVLDSADSIPALVDAAARSVPGDLGQLTSVGAQLEVAGDRPGPMFLVCTQGSHDMCCGTAGVALADEIESLRPDYEVRRVSHTGGHRFAPTLMAFPEGRMWAFADLSLVDRIAAGTESRHDFETRSRGWWGATSGPMQAAETAIRAELAGRRFVEPQIEAGECDTERSRYSVAADGSTWQVEVSVGREVPSVACETMGGLPAKTEREFTWALEAVHDRVHDRVRP